MECFITCRLLYVVFLCGGHFVCLKYNKKVQLYVGIRRKEKIYNRKGFYVGNRKQLE